MEFVYPNVSLYLYKSTIWSSMEYCFHVWAGTSSCYLDKLQKQIWRTVDPCLAAPLERLILSKCSQLKFHLNWLNWFHFYILEEGLLVILIGCITFRSPFLDVTRKSMSIIFFLAQIYTGILYRTLFFDLWSKWL